MFKVCVIVGGNLTKNNQQDYIAVSGKLHAN